MGPWGVLESENDSVLSPTTGACPEHSDFDLAAPDGDRALAGVARAFNFLLVRYPFDLTVPYISKSV